MALPLLLALCWPALPGCKAMVAQMLMWGQEPKKRVKAEYSHLAGKKVGVLVWVEPVTAFEYPQVQFEMSEFVIGALDGNVKGAKFVPSRRAVDLQRADANWDRADPALLARRLECERLLLIEVTQYSTRDPESPHLFRGQIQANVKVYDAEYENSQPAYQTLVEAAFPPDSIGHWGTNDREVRRGMMEAFAAELANRFCDHEVSMK